MGYVKGSINVADVLAGLTTDTTKWAGANINAILNRLHQVDFWSSGTILLDFTTTSATRALSSVAIPNLTGLTVRAAYAMLHIPVWRDNSGAENYNDIDQTIQADTGSAGWLSGGVMKASSLRMEANSRKHNMSMIFDVDIAAKVDFNQTTDLQLLTCQALGNSIRMYDIRTGIRVMV